MSDVFVEKQFFRGAPRILMLLATAPIPLLLGGLAYRQIVMGESVGKQEVPDGVLLGILAVVGILLPLLLVTMRLRTKVDPGGVTATLRPIYRKRIAAADIDGAEVITLDPLRDVGGWGIKSSESTGTALLMSGDTAVRFHLGDGRRFTVGTQRPDDLLRAVERVTGR